VKMTEPDRIGVLKIMNTLHGAVSGPSGEEEDPPADAPKRAPKTAPEVPSAQLKTSG
jgi:hypothetical protein